MKKPTQRLQKKQSTPATPTETLAYRTDGKHNMWVELFLTVPPSHIGDMRFYMEDFASKLCCEGLKLSDEPSDVDEWHWRTTTVKTTEKLIGRKLSGSKFVFHVWGFGKIPKTKAELTKHVPYAVEVVVLSTDKKFPWRRTPPA